MPLQDLPLELLDEICLYLPYTSLIALRWTSRVLYNDILAPLPTHWQSQHNSNDPLLKRLARDSRYPFHTLDGKINLDAEIARTRRAAALENSARARTDSIEDQRRCLFDLLLMECWPSFNTAAAGQLNERHEPDIPASMRGKLAPTDCYACHICLRLRAQSHFAIAQTRGDKKRGRYTPTMLLERQEKVGYYVAALAVEGRYCLQCGTKEGKYQKGALLQFIEEEGVVCGEAGRLGARKLVIGVGIVCKRCGEFRRVQGESKEALRRLCGECLKYRPP